MLKFAQRSKPGIAKLRSAGCEIIPISLPHTAYAIPTYYVIATAEASANLARFDGVRYGYRAKGARTLSEMYRKSRDEGFGAEVKRRIMLGTYALSSGYYDAYYLKAQRVRTLLTRDFEQAFQKVDAIVTPTAPTPAFKLGEKSDDPLSMYLADIYTVTADLAGIPGISVPVRQDAVRTAYWACRSWEGILMRARCLRVRGCRLNQKSRSAAKDPYPTTKKSSGKHHQFCSLLSSHRLHSW